MAYSLDNPPALMYQGLANQTASQFEYVSADAAATVAAAGYITNAKKLGMKVNDMVRVVDTATPLVTAHRVTAINATTGASTLSTGVTVGNT